MVFESLVKLFSSGGARKNNANALSATNDGVVPMGSAVVNAGTPRVDFTGSPKIRLWEHQKAMLHRVREIERVRCMVKTRLRYAERYMKKENVKESGQVAMGIMNDPPGAGKTYVMLALIAMDIPQVPGLNIVVTPKNLLGQWQDALGAFGVLPWVTATYELINKLYVNPSTFIKQRVVLMEETLVDSFALAMEAATADALARQINVPRINRIILDEVDNIAGSMTQPVGADKVWFVSASFKPDDKASLDGLPWELDGTRIREMICTTDPEFIAATVKLEEPETEVINCEDDDVALFADLVDDRVMIAIHAGNTRPLIKAIDYSLVGGANNIGLYDLAKWWCEDLSTKMLEWGREVADAEARMDETDPLLCEQLSKTIEIFRNKIVGASEKKALLSGRLDDMSSKPRGDSSQSKLARFENEIVKNIKAEGPLAKWLVFNDDSQGLIAAQGIFAKHGIVSEMLDGGDAKSVAKTLARFKGPIENNEKEKPVQVLLVNSASEGCGLNLENATHILFMHATKPELIGQIVGRAQRFGRTSRLRIVCLLNNTESSGV
jgi:hypothetical protein